MEKKAIRTDFNYQNQDLVEADKQTITLAGYDYLEDIVTDTTGDIYAFKDAASPIKAAASMVRLSRSPDDLRLIYLKEFSGDDIYENQLIERVFTLYGDDSVQQLMMLSLVVEGASNLLTKAIERCRLAAYLEQSTRYITFDQRDKHGNFRYLTPAELQGDLRQYYHQIMDEIFTIYSSLVTKMITYVRHQNPTDKQNLPWLNATKAQACDAVRDLLPASTRSTVGIVASAQTYDGLIMRLLGEDLLEFRHCGQAILDQARQVVGPFLQRTDMPDRGGATTAYLANNRLAMQALARDLLPAAPNDQQPTLNRATLIDYHPKNEFDIIADILYEHDLASGLSLTDIQTLVDNKHWSDDQLATIINTYVGRRLNRRHKPGRAFEKINYHWDILSDYGIFRDLQRHRLVNNFTWQYLTPRYGYKVPDLVVEAGFEQPFRDCFDRAENLYEVLADKVSPTVAQYATLMGHHLRWKISYNAREAVHLHELRTTPQGHINYRNLVNQMHSDIKAVHPLIADGMSFVNQGESPRLSRLAAEQYQQFKQRLIDSELKVKSGF